MEQRVREPAAGAYPSRARATWSSPRSPGPQLRAPGEAVIRQSMPSRAEELRVLALPPSGQGRDAGSWASTPMRLRMRAPSSRRHAAVADDTSRQRHQRREHAEQVSNYRRSARANRGCRPHTATA